LDKVEAEKAGNSKEKKSFSEVVEGWFSMIGILENAYQMKNVVRLYEEKFTRNR